MDKVLWSLNGVIQIMQTAQTCEMYDKKTQDYYIMFKANIVYVII